MSYKISYYPEASKFLEKVDKTTGDKIKNKIARLREDPKRVGKRLSHSRFWKLRIGKYRTFYEIDEKNEEIIILYIGHRKDVYDNFSKLF